MGVRWCACGSVGLSEGRVDLGALLLQQVLRLARNPAVCAYRLVSFLSSSSSLSCWPSPSPAAGSCLPATLARLPRSSLACPLPRLSLACSHDSCSCPPCDSRSCLLPTTLAFPAALARLLVLSPSPAAGSCLPATFAFPVALLLARSRDSRPCSFSLSLPLPFPATPVLSFSPLLFSPSFFFSQPRAFFFQRLSCFRLPCSLTGSRLPGWFTVGSLARRSALASVHICRQPAGPSGLVVRVACPVPVLTPAPLAPDCCHLTSPASCP